MTARRALIFSLLVLAGCASNERYGPDAESDERRTFHVRYVTQLEGLTPGGTVRLWIPAPREDPNQSISNLTVTPLFGKTHQETTDPVWGNRIVYLEATADAATATVTVEYDVARKEVDTSYGETTLENPDLYLAGSSLQAVTEDIRAVHAKVTPQSDDPLAIARAYYDHVLAEMSYDKSGEGWGRGDSQYACEVGKGNCTDFHSYFQALCMAQGIPSRFSIGIYGAYERKAEEYTTGGYHCWAEFHVKGYGWVPVDISEADKDPSKAEYFFGTHSSNRVTLSTGRDLWLEPKQAGEPLNYFVNPYAEVDGKPLPGVSKTAYWQDR